jgi:mono/diheme cytochrome c family protein
MAQFLASQQLVESGRKVYMIHCAGCHGTDAQGKGSTWNMLNPKPRNLVAGAFKFRSTSLGTLPTTADLIRTIEQGVLGASMPGFPLLSSQEKYALVAFIKSLRPDWQKNEGKAHAFPEVPVKIYRNKTLFLASAFRGSTLYQEGCATCHGVKGEGDGEGAEGLVDSDNQPIRPANLRAPYIKSGRRVQDIYKAIFTGLDGTPMPSFEGVYSEEQIWDLVSYVMFLRGQGAGLYEKDLQLNASMLKAAEAFGKDQKASSTQSVSAGSEDSWN